MRVQIAYSVELEDVPTKVSELVHEDLTGLKDQVVANLEESVSNLSAKDINRVALSLDNVEEAREVLETLSVKLKDYSSILKGYLNAKVQIAGAIAAQANQQATPVADPETPTPEAEPAAEVSESDSGESDAQQ